MFLQDKKCIWHVLENIQTERRQESGASMKEKKLRVLMTSSMHDTVEGVDKKMMASEQNMPNQTETLVLSIFLGKNIFSMFQ